jgi:hypothetical protein
MYALGYQTKGFLARNLTALGRLAKPDAVVSFIPYDHLIDLFVAIHQATLDHNTHKGHSSTSNHLCVCGPHVNLARHVVFYADGHHRQVVYLEPIVVQSSSTSVLISSPHQQQQQPLAQSSNNNNKKSTGVHHSGKRSFAWTGAVTTTSTQAEGKVVPRDTQKQPYSLYEQYVLTDLALRSRLHLDEGVPMATSIKVEFIQVEPSAPNAGRSQFADEEPRNFVNNNGARGLAQIDGQEALCIQYCEKMAYTLMSHMANGDATTQARLTITPKEPESQPTKG